MAMTKTVQEPGHSVFTKNLRGFPFCLIDDDSDSSEDTQVTNWWVKGRGRIWSEQPIISIFLCASPSYGFDDLLQDKDQLLKTFETIGISVKLYLDGAKSSLRKALECNADIRWIIAHGEVDGGVKCIDGDVDWSTFLEWMEPTGLLNMLPCYSANAWCEDEIDWLPLRDALSEKASAMILTAGTGIHFPWRYEKTKCHFEIERFAYLIQQSRIDGFRSAFQQTTEALRNNVPEMAPYILDHELAFGSEMWGKVSA